MHDDQISEIRIFSVQFFKVVLEIVFYLMFSLVPVFQLMLDSIKRFQINVSNIKRTSLQGRSEISNSEYSGNVNIVCNCYEN